MQVVAVITRVVAEAREASSFFLTPMDLARSSCLLVMLKSVEESLNMYFLNNLILTCKPDWYEHNDAETNIQQL